MSTTNNLPTRQQLEEIDALLKRMLSLPPLANESRDEVVQPPAPVSSGETPVAPAAYAEPRIQSWRVEWPTPASPVSTAMPPVAPAPAPSPVSAPMPTPAPATVAAWGSPVTPSAPVTHATPSRFNVYAPPVTPAAETVEHPRPYVSPPFSPAYPPGYAPQAYPTTPIPAVTPAPKPVAQKQQDQVVVVEGRSAWLFPIVALNWVYDILTYLLPMGSWWRSSGRVWMGRAAVLMFLTAAGWAAGEWQGVDWPKADMSRINLSRFGWAK